MINIEQDQAQIWLSTNADCSLTLFNISIYHNKMREFQFYIFMATVKVGV